jgi:hypothetical protein
MGTPRFTPELKEQGESPIRKKVCSEHRSSYKSD